MPWIQIKLSWVVLTLTLGTFRLCGLDVDWDVLTPLSISQNKYYACVTTWMFVHYQKDDTKLADFMSSSRIVNVHPRHDAGAVSAQRDQLTSACLSPCSVHTIESPYYQACRTYMYWQCTHLFFFGNERVEVPDAQLMQHAQLNKIVSYLVW